MNSNKKIDRYLKYSIKRSAGIGHKHKEVAKVWMGDDGELWYEMIIPDKDVEHIILKAQKDGGLYMRIPYSKHRGKLCIEAQKKHFIPVNDKEIFNAIEFNLENGLVEPENISDQ